MWQKHRKKILDVIVIIALILLPGIRGYSNWQIHEYLLILIPIAVILYSWGAEKKT